MTPEEEKLIQDHPIESFYYNADDFATFQSALTEPFPKPDTMEHLVYCEDGFYFHKGSMPFKALLKQDTETKKPYLDIAPYGKGFPHLTIPACSKEELPTAEAFCQKLNETVDKVFRDGTLDPKLIQPTEYLKGYDDFDDFLEKLQYAAMYPIENDGAILAQRDIGDVRMRISYTPVIDGTTGACTDHACRIHLTILKDPTLPFETAVQNVAPVFLPKEIFQCKTSEAVRDLLNVRISAIVKGENDNALKNALGSKECRWMQYELYHAKKVDLAGYLDHDGNYQEYETDMDARKQIQFSKVLTDALLREQPSKTLWIEPIEDEKQGVPLTDFKILGVAEGADAMTMSCPAFKIQLADGRETIALPEELFPSLMRDAGCPYTEKEYGIPLDLIPKPIYERGLLGPVPALRKSDRKAQALPIVKQNLQELFKKIQSDWHLSADDVTKLVHKAASSIQQNAHTNAKEGR